MKIPKEIVISGHTIKVKQVIPDEAKENFIGRLETKNLVIELNMSYTEDMIKEALIHEILHAADIIYNLDLNEYHIGVISAVVFKLIKEGYYVKD